MNKRRYASLQVRAGLFEDGWHIGRRTGIDESAVSRSYAMAQEWIRRPSPPAGGWGSFENGWVQGFQDAHPGNSLASILRAYCEMRRRFAE